MKNWRPMPAPAIINFSRAPMDQSNQSATTRLHVWDLPLRAFHWLLAVAVVTAVITGEIGGPLIDWHARVGILILGLFAFRLVWGFLGSTHARFRHFLPRPSALWAHVTGHWRGVGHNPLGAISVLAILTLVAAQTITGLFANDDIAFQGPLFDVVSKELSDTMTAIHGTIFNALLALVGLHVAAIAYYARAKGENLVMPMITGYKTVPADLAHAVRPAGLLRALIAVVVAASIAWGVGSGWLGSQLAPPAAPAPAPAW
jgi:cytochrome b